MSPNSSGNRDLADICSYGLIGERRLTPQEKQYLVAASFVCGLSEREFAARQGVGYSTLTRWRRVGVASRLPDTLVKNGGITGLLGCFVVLDIALCLWLALVTGYGAIRDEPRSRPWPKDPDGPPSAKTFSSFVRLAPSGWAAGS